LRVQRETADRIALENEITRGETLSRAELEKGFSAIASAISARVMSCSELPLAARQDILKDLSSWPVVIADTARKQTRFRRAKNGPEPEEE
jgi:hypothetical protein